MDFFYLSQVLSRPVYTGRGERVARIKDVVARLEALNHRGEFTQESYPPISGLVVEISKREIFISYDLVKSLGPEGARLSSARIDLRNFQRREGEVLLARDMLDKQLIDIDGRRVIRANDLQLFSREGITRLSAVDVSAEAIARRLVFGRMFNKIHIPSLENTVEIASREGKKLQQRREGPARFISWADVEPLHAGVPDVRLRFSHERLAKLNPVDIARIADELSYHEGAHIIQSLDDETAAETLQEMDDERQADIVESMDRERAADILEEMDPDNAADLLADLEERQAQDLLRRMDPDDADDVKELLAYEEKSAGGIMTSDFISVPEHMTVNQTIELMRRMDDPPDLIDYLYVIEEPEHEVDWATHAQESGGRLWGIVKLRDLLLSPASVQLRELMATDYVSVRPNEPYDKAARMMADYNLLALPVVDGEGRVLGIITVDDAIDVLLPEKWQFRMPRVFS